MVDVLPHSPETGSQCGGEENVIHWFEGGGVTPTAGQPGGGSRSYVGLLETQCVTFLCPFPFNVSSNALPLLICVCVFLVSLPRPPPVQEADAVCYGCQAVTLETFCIIDEERSLRPKHHPNCPSRAQPAEEASGSRSEKRTTDRTALTRERRHDDDLWPEPAGDDVTPCGSKL